MYNKPYIRKVELRIQRKGVKVFNLVSDGSRDGLQMTFSVNKAISGMPKSTIDIYNMSPDSRRVLMEGNGKLDVQLYVGWNNVAMSLLAAGGIMQVIPEKIGTSNKVQMNFADSYRGISSSTYSNNYPANTSVAKIVQDLAKRIEGVEVVAKRIEAKGVVGGKGYIVNGRIAKELDKLANSYAFTWSVQNGIFQALNDSGSSSERIYEISPQAGNLFSATASLVDMFQTVTAMEISAFLNPKIIPGDTVNLKSDFVPMYNGKYKVYNITFDGDTNGSQWAMKIESKFGGAIRQTGVI